MDSPSVPFINHGRYSVHTIDSLHEGGRDSSREEINEGVFMGDFAEGDVVFELGDVVSKQKVLGDGSGGEPCNSFVLDVNVDESHFEVIIKGGPHP